jgi:hypothetical protein
VERESPYGPSHVDDGGGDALHLNLEQERTRQLERERPGVSSHVEDGGGTAFQSEQVDRRSLNAGEVTNDRTSEVIRSSPEIDRQ